MDSLTQIVLGASVGEAVLGKKVGNKAMLYGAIAGTIPDLDVLSRNFVDTVTAIEWHRGFSHSILFSLMFAPVFGWLISKIERKSAANWRDWTRLMFWGLFTHPILDAFTTWGTQLFWPIDLKLAFQNIFVIDPLYTVPFLICLILAMRLNRVSDKRRRLNKMGLVLSSSYLIITLILKWFTYNKFINNLEEQGVEYTEIATRPTPFNTLLWTANVDTKNAYLIGNYSLFDSQPVRFKAYPKNHELLGKWSDNDKVRRLINVTEGWYTVEKNEGLLYLNDLRFGLISMQEDESRFAFNYEIRPTANDEVQITETPKYEGGDPRKLFGALWYRILGN
ncbi:metal-dependent hydrolase [Poritiphilus flavus]|uniref:Metal-dependent hydrolase n=1 Tax=Poritiphilus flavus TaxID=2697053 RepID=A0A6L9E6W0_9FLAO|nr:metal-dependent hydrolase [Poritiphilus flavus]NAS10446.1 metal-dependent hydrolase [Poritiphilus flavus]